jgi:hypothetical protein
LHAPVSLVRATHSSISLRLQSIRAWLLACILGDRYGHRSYAPSAAAHPARAATPVHNGAPLSHSSTPLRRASATIPNRARVALRTARLAPRDTTCDRALPSSASCLPWGSCQAHSHKHLRTAGRRLAAFSQLTGQPQKCTSWLRPRRVIASILRQLPARDFDLAYQRQNGVPSPEPTSSTSSGRESMVKQRFV